MLRVAAFADAGYVWKQLWKALCPDADDRQYARSKVQINYSAFHGALIGYIASHFRGIPFLRCYWYDGPLSDGAISTEHKKIANLNDFKLRLGHRATEAVTGKQKGVDGFIIADLISLAQSKAISHALLLSGDGDMVPGVGVAQSLGVRVHLLTIHSALATSPNLKSEADHYALWQISDIKGFARLKESTTNITPPVEEKIQTPQDITSAQLNNRSSIAKQIFEELCDEEKMVITSSFIPHNIDKRLIRAGYEDNSSRALTESQKRLLRAEFRNMAVRYQTSK